MGLAPIGLSVYIRLEHTKKTIEALRKNTLAKESVLYVFSDGPKKGDEQKVKEMRNYLKTIDGFKKIEIIERKENNRIKNSRGGLQYLLDKYGKAIFMQEDIVTAPGFLQFLNDALEFYKDDERILSVGGHTPNLSNNIKDVYFVRRFHPWGFGIWKSRYYKIKPCNTYNLNELKNKLDEYGTDLYYMSISDSKGEIDALDVRACCLMAKENLYTVLPTQTLVKNIGLDGSGLHCGSVDIYKNHILSDKVKFKLENYYYNKTIHEEYKKFYDKSTSDHIISQKSEKLKKILNKIGNEPIAIYGTGQHTKKLMNYINFDKFNFIGLIDYDTEKIGHHYFGFKVYDIETVIPKVKHIIISSLSFQDIIYERISWVEKKGINVIKLYDKDDFQIEF